MLRRLLPSSPRRAAALVTVTLAAALASCGEKSDGEPSAPGTMLGSGGEAPMSNVQLLFAGTPIEVAPREQRNVSLHVTPAGAYTVRLSLLGAAGDAAPDDASLDRSEAITDAHGDLTFVLTAPSSPGELSLRAQVGDLTVTTPVTVNADARLDLVIRPQYSGQRPLTNWLVTAYPNVACGELDFAMLPASELELRASIDAPLALRDVPLVPRLSVLVRAGAVARGCTTVDRPLPRSEIQVTVDVADLPLALAGTSLDASFTLDASDAAFQADLDATLVELQAALRAGAENDIVALLEEMQASLSGDAADQFSAARVEENWDETLVTALGHGAETRLSDSVARWSDLGRRAQLDQLMDASLEATDSDDVPVLTVQRFASIDAANVELSAEPDTWTLDASDTLSFAANVSFSAKALLAGVAATAAQAETGATEVPQALALVLSCSQVGATLATGRSDPALALVAVCDSECLETRCADALGNLWQRARAASDGDPSELSVAASGAVSVDDAGHIASWSGAWAARLTRSGESRPTRGSVEAYRPR